MANVSLGFPIRWLVHLLLVVVATAAVLGAAPASAHGCGVPPVRIAVDRKASVTIGVDNDGVSPVTSIDVKVPAGFDLDRVAERPGWTSARDGSQLTFTQGRLMPGTCVYFGLVGTPTRRAVLAFSITTRAEDGTERAFTGKSTTDEFPAQLVYAGVDPPSASDPGEKQRPVQFYLGFALFALGVGGIAVMAFRSRQSARPRRPPPRSRSAAAPSPRRPAARAANRNRSKKKAKRRR